MRVSRPLVLHKRRRIPLFFKPSSTAGHCLPPPMHFIHLIYIAVLGVSVFVSAAPTSGTQITITVHQTGQSDYVQRCMESSECPEGSYCYRTSPDYGLCVLPFASAVKDQRVSNSMDGGHGVC
ncbi:hypothetical protein MVEN_02340000 [Mycena venus]|uniref:Uncharacterized protein n=1 Tax=Mycena venus TaxID=2733690 RepID=A0A8H6X442_9AGAR|nr:hypothetical protein MVEN_02340000 [Mycena venus]